MNEKEINYSEIAERVIKGIKEKTEKKCVEMKFVNKETSIIESKVGGVPFMPQGEEYPVDKVTGRKLHLLIQLNFAEMPQIPDYPRKGILQIYIADDDLHGMDMKIDQYQESWRIRFYEDISNPLSEEEIKKMMPSLDEIDADCLPFQNIGTSCGIEFEENSMVITTSDWQFESIFKELISDELPKEKQFAEFWEYPDDLSNKVYDFCGGTGSRIGGYPFFTQWDCRGEGSDEILLFQLDSFGIDNEWFLMWGDSGVANFFIKPEDLKNRDFSNVNYNWDCM